MPCFPCRQRVRDVNGDVDEAGSRTTVPFLKRAKRFVSNKVRSLCGRTDNRVHPLDVPDDDKDSAPSTSKKLDREDSKQSRTSLYLTEKRKRKRERIKNYRSDVLHKTFKKRIERYYRQSTVIKFKGTWKSPGTNCVYVFTLYGVHIFFTIANFPPTVALPRYLTVDENMANMSFPPRGPGRVDDSHDEDEEY